MEEEIQTAENQVETETTAPSASETETTPDVETSEAPTLEEPTETDVEKPSRAQDRIKQLNKKLKDAEEKAGYWDALVARTHTPEKTETSEEDGEVTVDQIADAVLKKQAAVRAQDNLVTAANNLQKDLVETLSENPDLADDDELAELVVNLAQAKGITLKAAAGRVKARLRVQEETGAKKKTAEEAIRTGVTSPQGGHISKGEPKKVDISKMSPEEEKAHWNEILESYSQ